MHKENIARPRTNCTPIHIQRKGRIIRTMYKAYECIARRWGDHCVSRSDSLGFWDLLSIWVLLFWVLLGFCDVLWIFACLCVSEGFCVAVVVVYGAIFSGIVSIFKQVPSLSLQYLGRDIEDYESCSNWFVLKMTAMMR